MLQNNIIKKEWKFGFLVIVNILNIKKLLNLGIGIPVETMLPLEYVSCFK